MGAWRDGDTVPRSGQNASDCQGEGGGGSAEEVAGESPAATRVDACSNKSSTFAINIG